MFARILVPLDGSALAEQVLPVVQALVAGQDTEITLLAVGEPAHSTGRRRTGLRQPVPIAGTFGGGTGGVLPASAPTYAESKDQVIEREEHELLGYLEAVAHPLREAHQGVRPAVSLGEPAKEIIDFAKRGGFGAIVMATHGRSGLKEALHGSVTAEVIRRGGLPVMVIRPEQATGSLSKKGGTS